MTDENRSKLDQICSRNPSETVDALTRDDGISIAQQIVLVRMKSPLLVGDVSDPVENAKAVYAMTLPVGRAALLANDIPSLESAALEWVDGVSREDFSRMLDALLSAILLFWKLLPRSDGGEKKKGAEKSSASATETSRNSSNGRAAPTDGHSTTRRGLLRRFRSLFSTDAGRRARAV